MNEKGSIAMSQDETGVPSGPGHSAEPEPISVVSAQRASVPNAAEPGPWSFCECGCGFIGGNDAVAKVYCGPWGDEGVDFVTGERSIVHQWGDVPAERAIANGRMIAAAPALYAALKHILDGALSLPRFAEEEARVALALAQGIEAATAVETTKICSTEGESPVRDSECAQTPTNRSKP
jgi:hypothetical protein